MYFKYLGIIITVKPSEALQVNIDPLMHTIRTKLATWAKLPLSVAGRINLIKMILLPSCWAVMPSSRRGHLPPSVAHPDSPILLGGPSDQPAPPPAGQKPEQSRNRL